MWCAEARAAEQAWAVPHSHVVDKNQEGYLGRRAVPVPGQTAQPRVPPLGR